MKNFLIAAFLFASFSLFSQVCVTFNGSTLVNDNGNGTCTYNVTLTVDSGNGASGTATFSIGGAVVYVQNNCVCNPTTITFPITVACNAIVNISVFYDAPGNGNNCSGSTGDISLPIELADFEVNKNATSHILTWKTLSEINNDRFEIEHAASNLQFKNIGTVKGAINSSITQEYSFNHVNPPNGLNYYRLKQVDLDGSFSYSKVIYISLNRVEYHIFPNPFYDFINIETQDELYWVIRNVNGVQVAQGNDNFIYTTDLIAGMYSIEIKSSEGIQKKMLVKI